MYKKLLILANTQLFIHEHICVQAEKRTMNNNLSPILSFRDKLENKNISVLNNKKKELNSVSTMITRTRESIDLSENS